ncbi:MAG: hydrogenase expression/formation protein HypE [Planctomycetota bacterium]
MPTNASPQGPESSGRGRSAPSTWGACPLPISQHQTIQLAHGSGGRLMDHLIHELFLRAFDNPVLGRLDDHATLELGGLRLSVSTDSFVVDPLFFPGGDIGELAVNGTVNDVSMGGARPLFLTAGFILEEGFPLGDLERIVASMQHAAERAGVVIVAGDTKVVNRGKGDKVFINTTGIGVIEHDHTISCRRLAAGDRLLLSGTVADHGIAILSQREGLSFDTPIESDTAPLNELVHAMVAAGGSSVHALRDPTRGGLAATLDEFAQASAVSIRVQEAAIPVKPAVAGACELLGLDALHIANEGKLVAAVAPDRADRVLAVMRSHELGRDAACIGEVVAEPAGLVSVQTRLGPWRVLDRPAGEPLPRIC